jgi:ABC-type transport system involved in Fe-S cluster assembly fused permease/ATPase subunit
MFIIPCGAVLVILIMYANNINRLNTIMDSDRIVVLEKGLLHEFDSPATLLAKPDSLLAVMHRAMQQEMNHS